MRDFDDSTLWRISAYERLRAETGRSGFAPLQRTTALPSTLHAELTQLEQRRQATDTLEVAAACLRQHEAALLVLRLRGLVWPVTLFPQQGLYHCPRSVVDALREGGRDLEIVDIEPPVLRPPGHAMHERVGDGAGYRALPPLLWALALYAPRTDLLSEIAGRAAYRLAPGFAAEGAVSGAIGAALVRLRTEIASLQDIARWPGIGTERAARLLNGVYLQGGLIVLHTHRAARHAEGGGQRLAAWWRGGK